MVLYYKPTLQNFNTMVQEMEYTKLVIRNAREIFQMGHIVTEARMHRSTR